MTDQFGPNEQVCLLNGSTRCNRIWVSQLDGLRLTHFQTLAQGSVLEEDDATGRFRHAQVSEATAYAQCSLGCLGPSF